MFDNILKMFKTEESTELSTEDARLALTALMVRLARTDGDYAAIEIAMIDSVISKRFNLDPKEAQALRTQGESLEMDAPDTVRFTRIIKEAVSYEDRSGVVEALWSVVLADGHKDHEEQGLMRLVANLLGVNDRDSAFARQRAQKSTE